MKQLNDQAVHLICGGIKGEDRSYQENQTIFNVYFKPALVISGLVVSIAALFTAGSYVIDRIYGD